MAGNLDEASHADLEELGDAVPLDLSFAVLQGDPRLLGVGRPDGATGTAAAAVLSVVLVPVVEDDHGSAEERHDQDVIDEDDHGSEDAKGLDGWERRDERTQEGRAGCRGRDRHCCTSSAVDPAHPRLEVDEDALVVLTLLVGVHEDDCKIISEL